MACCFIELSSCGSICHFTSNLMSFVLTTWLAVFCGMDLSGASGDYCPSPDLSKTADWLLVLAFRFWWQNTCAWHKRCVQGTWPNGGITHAAGQATNEARCPAACGDVNNDPRTASPRYGIILPTVSSRGSRVDSLVAHWSCCFISFRLVFILLSNINNSFHELGLVPAIYTCLHMNSNA